MSNPVNRPTGYGTGLLVTLIGLAVVLLLAVVVLVGMFALRGDDSTPLAVDSPPPAATGGDVEEPAGDDQPGSDDPTPTPGGRVPPGAESDEDDGPPISSGPTGPKQVRVFGTLGKNWKADRPGEGWVAVRSKPGKDGKRLGRLAEGEAAIVECTRKGITYTSGLFDITSNVWARTTDGHYIAAVYLQDADENLMHVKGTLKPC